MYNTLFGCLTCSAAPPGYSCKGDPIRGDALWALQDKQGTRVGAGEGDGMEERRRGTHSPSGNLRQLGCKVAKTSPGHNLSGRGSCLPLPEPPSPVCPQWRPTPFGPPRQGWI